jgi:ABC-2 type transport system ATP-binding protein
LAAEGLSILISTPYLDEAERCNRIALIHKGEIQKIGTPAELREALDAKRLEVRVDNLSEAERVLSEVSGPKQDIMDVERFGDRLDVLAHDPDKARQIVEELCSKAGLHVSDVRIDEPTLENVFVAGLRALGEESKDPTFPGRHDHSNLRGQIAVGADNLTKQFGAFTAVKNVTLEIPYGEIYGLLGANGAGKTTTIRMLCGLLEATSGSMRLAGEQGNLRSESIRQQIGYMSQKFSLYNDMTIRENLSFFAGVYGVPASERDEKIRWVVSFSGLEGKEDQITGSLPGGWKQRVAFGAAIMHEPSVLFLDEPTSGVDPLARRAFWVMINRLADAGTAILVTTHYLEESEQCNRLGFMAGGELVAQGTPSGIKSAQTGHLLEFSVDQPQRAADVLKSDTERWRVSLFGDRLHVVTDEDVEAGKRTTTEKLASNGISVISARETPFSLEDVFINVIEKARQQGKAAPEE